MAKNIAQLDIDKYETIKHLEDIMISQSTIDPFRGRTKSLQMLAQRIDSDDGRWKGCF
jgi:hypothetical protein